MASSADPRFVLVFDLVRLSAPVPWLSGRASASHAEGRWFDPSRDHKRLRRSDEVSRPTKHVACYLACYPVRRIAAVASSVAHRVGRQAVPPLDDTDIDIYISGAQHHDGSVTRDINSRSRAGHRCRSNETMCARRRKEDITWLV